MSLIGQDDVYRAFQAPCARRCRSNVRKVDLVFRYGGDEFIIAKQNGRNQIIGI